MGKGAWRPPREVRPEAPRALEAVCRKAMALKPEERYPTALKPAGDTYKVSCYLSRCVPLAAKDAKLPEAQRKELADAYAARAVQLLREAVARGYKDVAHIKMDTSLDPLRKRPDFQQLLAELGEKEDK